MEKPPTAEELLANDIDYIKEVIDDEDLYLFYRGVICEFAIEFAKLHVETCKKEIVGKAECNNEGTYDRGGESTDYYVVDEDSILNAYPLTNIK